MFTFTAEQLKQFLSDAITYYAGESYMEFTQAARKDRQATINYMIAQLETSQPQRNTLRENSLPTMDEDDEFEATEPNADDLPCPEFSLEIDDLEWQDNIPFDGQPIPYKSDDDSPAGLGLPPMA